MDEGEQDLSAALECVQLGVDAYDELPADTQAMLPTLGMWLRWDKAMLEQGIPA